MSKKVITKVHTHFYFSKALTYIQHVTARIFVFIVFMSNIYLYLFYTRKQDYSHLFDVLVTFSQLTVFDLFYAVKR